MGDEARSREEEVTGNGDDTPPIARRFIERSGEAHGVGRRVVRVGVLRQRLWPAGFEDPAAAFVAAVHAEHGAALLSFALRVTGDRGHAEDAVQETLLRAWKNAAALAADDRPLRP